MTTISVRSPYRLSDIAAKLGIPVRELQRWNPELMRGITPPPQRLPGQQYALRMPKPIAERFASIESQLSQLLVQDVQIHRIQKGETLIDIARRYKVSVQQLLQYNPDLRPQYLRPGQNVAVPVPAVVEAPTERQAV
jgi:membrane-bound lytic murein transglycosylase D